MSEWRPIETAPKDGTPVLLWGQARFWTDEFVPVTGWYAQGSRKWVSHADYLKPTHWQPLPEPPHKETEK